MSILFSFFLMALTTFSVFAMEPDLERGHANHVTICVHNVGQGNFVTLEIPHKTDHKKEYIIVDCGSGSSQHELGHIAKRKEEKEGPLTLKKLLQKKRFDNFGSIEGEDSLHITGLILTHPDSDHINQLHKLINYKTDKIDYLICSGLPEMYQKTRMDFGEWIDKLIESKSCVYFPAISYEPIGNFGQVLPTYPESYQPYPAWAGRKFTSEDYKRHPFPEFIKALAEINEDFRLYFLAVNPTHITGDGGTVRLTNATTRSEKEKETNTDSLVLKISYGDTSMILPGDATGITTSRIQSTYSAPFLKSPVLLLAHHGADTEGSNNDVWLTLVQPQYILISAGHTYGHPHKKALKRFQALESLKRKVTPHKISWAKSGTRRKKKMINDAIFLTYESGDLITELFKDGRVKLTTQIEEEIRDLAAPPPSSSSTSHGKKRPRLISEKEPQQKAKRKKTKSKEKQKEQKKTLSNSSEKKSGQETDSTGKQKGKEKEGRK